jgi:ABC-2 type transport system ATP-binding protein
MTNAPETTRRSQPVIRTERLTRSFGRFVAVREVSFEVTRGEIFGYLGANGAGKSTTIRMLCGLLSPTAGAAWVNGISIAEDPERVKRSLGYMSQRFSLYPDLQVEENLEFFGGAYGMSGAALGRRIDEVLEQIDLTRERSARTGDLPGGLRQRVALASALLHQPEILFLDEPTAGVAPAARRAFWRLIRELAASGRTVFVTTHYMDEAEYCHRIGLMVDGRLVALDTPAGLKRTHVQGELHELSGAELARAVSLLAGQEGVLAVQAFGAAAHLRLDPGRTDAARIAARLEGAGLRGLGLKRIEPSLEDVFLAVVERNGNGAGPPGAA